MSPENQDKLSKFFALYNQFDYKPTEGSRAAYSRLVAFFGWEANGKKERKAKERFQEALVAQFEQLYGADENKLDVLQTLCGKIGISPIPSTVTQCKKVCFDSQVPSYTSAVDSYFALHLGD